MSTPKAQKTAPFSEHLREFVWRIRLALTSIVAGAVVAYFFSGWLFDQLTRPVLEAGAGRLHFASPVEPFFTYLKVALIGGIILSGPYVLYQIWAFVSPGLYEEEKRLVLPFVFFTILLFFGGVLFGYFVVLPYGFRFLLGYAETNPNNYALAADVARWLGVEVDWKALGVSVTPLEPTIMMGDYLNLVAKLLLAFGLVFELPLFMFFLARLGLVTARKFVRFFKYFVVLAFFVAAVLTPPDVITQVLMALPLLGMYLLGILLAHLAGRSVREYEDPIEEFDRSLPEDRWEDDSSSP